MDNGDVLGFLYEDTYTSPPTEDADYGFAHTLEYTIQVKDSPQRILDLYWSKDVDNEPWYLMTQHSIDDLRHIPGFAPLREDA